jgi:hypothetical protein
MQRKLDILTVKNPCSVSWEGMEGEGAVRHCGRCRKNVFDLSAMTEADALELIALSEGDLCVRFRRRADGTVVNADCPTARAPRAVRMRRLALAGALGAAVAAPLAMPLAGGPEPTVLGGERPPPPEPCRLPVEGPEVEPERVVMGEMIAAPEIIEMGEVAFDE